jgi:hypothetical protein
MYDYHGYRQLMIWMMSKLCQKMSNGWLVSPLWWVIQCTKCKNGMMMFPWIWLLVRSSSLRNDLRFQSAVWRRTGVCWAIFHARVELKWSASHLNVITLSTEETETFWNQDSKLVRSFASFWQPVVQSCARRSVNLRTSIRTCSDLSRLAFAPSFDLFAPKNCYGAHKSLETRLPS